MSSFIQQEREKFSEEIDRLVLKSLIDVKCRPVTELKDFFTASHGRLIDEVVKILDGHRNSSMATIDGLQREILKLKE